MKKDDKHLIALYDAVIEALYANEVNAAWLSSIAHGQAEKELVEMIGKLRDSQERLKLLRSQLTPP